MHTKAYQFFLLLLISSALNVAYSQTCIAPNKLMVNQNDFTVPASVELSWTENNTPPAEMWEIEYGPEGFTTGTGSMTTVFTNPYTLGGLLPGSYDYYVKADCGDGADGADGGGDLAKGSGLSPYSTPLTFPVIGISQTDADGDGNPEIMDPCSCADPQNILGAGNVVTYFHDFITVTSTTGEMWEITAINSGAGSMVQNDGTTNIAVNTQLTETPAGSGVYRIDFWHPAGTGFDADVNRVGTPLATALNVANSCTACAQVPTLGEWGLILLSLMIAIFGVLAVRQTEPSLAIAGAGNIPSRKKWLHFDKALFGKMLAIVMTGLAIAFTVATVFFGYEMTAADVPGSLVAGPLAAYLLHLVFGKK